MTINGINKQKKLLIKSEFFRSSGILFLSSIASNIIALSGFLIMAKIYSADTLGQLYVFTAATGIITMFVLIGYQQAIPLMSDSDLGSAIRVGIPIAVVVTALTVPFLFFLDYWYLFAPIVLFSLIIQIGEMVLVRDRCTKQIALYRIVAPIILYIASIVCFYVYGDRIMPLLFAQITGTVIASWMYWNYAISRYFRDGNVRHGLEVLKKYVRFPKFIGPGMVFHSIAYNLPVIIAGQYFTMTTAATYNMAFKLTFLPMQMLGGAITQVYTGHLSERRKTERDIFDGFNRLRFALLITATVSCLGIYIFTPIFVKYFLSSEWADSVAYCYALIPLMFAMVAIAPLSTMFQFTDNQKYIFKVHATSLVISVLAFGSAAMYGDFLVGVVIFSMLMLVRYIFIYKKLNSIRSSKKCGI